MAPAVKTVVTVVETVLRSQHASMFMAHVLKDARKGGKEIVCRCRCYFPSADEITLLIHRSKI